MECKRIANRGASKGRPATGTFSGFMRHKRAGEVPCDACRRAKTRRNNAQAAAKREPRREFPATTT